MKMIPNQEPWFHGPFLPRIPEAFGVRLSCVALPRLEGFPWQCLKDETPVYFQALPARQSGTGEPHSKSPSGEKALLMAVIFITLSACTTPTVKVDPTLLHSSYDYTRPAEIAEQSKPVWVLPIINQGWVPAKVDPRTGDWISGHYTASIIQDGHWATLEEAELAGRPYVVAGESKPVVPIPEAASEAAQKVPSTSISEGEFDVTALDRRVGLLEQKAGAGSGSAGLLQQGQELYLPGRAVSGDVDIPVESMSGSISEKIQVHYLPGNVVRVLYQGKTYQVQLNNPGDRIRIVLPKPIS